MARAACEILRAAVCVRGSVSPCVLCFSVANSLCVCVFVDRVHWMLGKDQ